MATHKLIYDLDGQPWEVPEVRANDLVLNKGWSQTPFVKMEEPVEPEADAEEADPSDWEEGEEGEEGVEDEQDAPE